MIGQNWWQVQHELRFPWIWEMAEDVGGHLPESSNGTGDGCCRQVALESGCVNTFLSLLVTLPSACAVFLVL